MSKNKEKLKVKVCCVNKGQKTQYYILKLAEPGNEQVLPYAPNNWKTSTGAATYAEKNGYEVVKEPTKKPVSQTNKKTCDEKAMYVASVLVEGKAMYEMVDGSITNNLTRKDIALYASNSTAQKHAENLARKLKKERRGKVKPFTTKVTVSRMN